MLRPRISRKPRTVLGVELRRDEHGVVHVSGQDDVELARGLGSAHATDRLVNMELLRLIGQGRLSECLLGEPEMVVVDRLMRDLDFARMAARDVTELDGDVAAVVDAYCQGVNQAMGSYRPAEFRLVGHRPAPWDRESVLLTVGVMSWIGLAQSQQDGEKVLIQALAAGVEPGKLREIFSPHLDGMDEEIVSLLRKTRLDMGLVPPEARFLSGLSLGLASNAWAVSPERSATGRVLHCLDPHLEVNRLPGLWYEWVGVLPDDYRLGITMPGIPGTVMGRTRHVAAGFSYGFMDLVDFFIEEVRDGRVRRPQGWAPVEERQQTLRTKGRPDVVLTSRHTDQGVLEVDPEGPLEDGLYLGRCWAAERFGSAPSLKALTHWVRATDLDQARAALCQATIACNWVVSDRHGRIAYQQSGLLPGRAHSGVYPLPAWREGAAWQGRVPPEELVHFEDPPEGLVVTANNDLNRPGFPQGINLPMGPYRAERITALLEEGSPLDLDAMASIQNDLYSLQAEEFMAVLAPLLPQGPGADALRAWDLRYDAASTGATAFEAVYQALQSEVFGRGLFGTEAWRAMTQESGFLADYYHLFDQVLLEGPDHWFGQEGREALFARVAAEALDAVELRPWGEVSSIWLENVFFGGKLPRWLGLDRGPVPLVGCRATVVQGGLFESMGRVTSFAPSWRFLTDMGEDSARTVLAGGPSESPLSRWYTTDVQRWLSGEYKELHP